MQRHPIPRPDARVCQTCGESVRLSREAHLRPALTILDDGDRVLGRGRIHKRAQRRRSLCAHACMLGQTNVSDVCHLLSLDDRWKAMA
jgi:hypothetical protein